MLNLEINPEDLSKIHDFSSVSDTRKDTTAPFIVFGSNFGFGIIWFIQQQPIVIVVKYANNSVSKGTRNAR